MPSASFAKLITVTASTKRSPNVSGGKRGAPATWLTLVMCTPLDPVDAELRQRMALETPHELKHTFTDADLDITEGDFLVVNGVEYPIKAVEDWEWRGSKYLHLVIEEIKR